MQVKVSVSTIFLMILSAEIMLIPPAPLLCILLASLVHEFFHIIVGLGMGGMLSHIMIYPQGARIEMLYLTKYRAILSTIAGPIGSFSLFLFWRRLPLLSLFGMIEGIINLLPIFPFDGGRIIRLLRNEQ